MGICPSQVFDTIVSEAWPEDGSYYTLSRSGGLFYIPREINLKIINFEYTTKYPRPAFAAINIVFGNSLIIWYILSKLFKNGIDNLLFSMTLWNYILSVNKICFFVAHKYRKTNAVNGCSPFLQSSFGLDIFNYWKRILYLYNDFVWYAYLKQSPNDSFFWTN